MSVFESVKLNWSGVDYTIAPNKMMGAIARIEDVITLSELQKFGSKGSAPLAKIAMAYGSVLRYAGANVTDEEVYAGMFSASSKAAAQEGMIASISTLLMMMIPPDTLRQANFDGGGAAMGETKPTTDKSPLSRKRSRLRSERGG